MFYPLLFVNARYSICGLYIRIYYHQFIM